MRHLILIILVTILTQTAFAQYQSGKVVYKVIPPKTVMEFKDTTNIKNKYTKNAFVTTYNRLKSHAPNMQLVLEFNTKNALAKMPSMMKVDNRASLQTAMIATKFHREYYTEIESNYQIHEFEIAGREWTVRYDRDISSWEITNETKEIHGYTCYKAITPIKINGEEIDDNLEAWFTPEIPFRYGPMEIYGLPGLILEVRQKNFIYYATEIELYKKNNNIKKPKRKPILHTEYHAEMKKMRDAFK